MTILELNETRDFFTLADPESHFRPSLSSLKLTLLIFFEREEKKLKGLPLDISPAFRCLELCGLCLSAPPLRWFNYPAGATMFSISLCPFGCELAPPLNSEGVSSPQLCLLSGCEAEAA